MTIKLRIIQTLLLSMLMGAGVFLPGCGSSQPQTPCCNHSPATSVSPAPSPRSLPSTSTNGGTFDILEVMDFYSTPYVNGTNVLTDLMDWSWQDADEPNPEVMVADFTYTDEDLNDKLCWLSQTKHVKVRVILDKLEYNAVKGKLHHPGSSAESVHIEQELVKKLEAAGVEVQVGSSEGGSIMHVKMIVVNRKWFYDGSFNLTAVANKQNNHLWITKKRCPQPHAAGVLLDDWQKMYDFIKDDKRSVNDGKRHRPRK